MLWRGRGEAQVGIARPVILRGLSEADMHAVAMLEAAGITSRDAQPDSIRPHLARLRLAGLMDDAPAAQERHVAIHGLGAIGLAAALSLARIPGMHLHLVDEALASIESASTYATARGTCAGAALETIEASVPGAVARVGLGRVDAALVVSAGAPSMEACVPLMADETPHVLVTADEAGVTVGPVVLPGRTACATCLGLWAAESDSAWPLLASQLGSRRPAAPAPLACAAGSLAALLVAACAEGAPDEALLHGAWRFDGLTPPRRLEVTAHPLCGCADAIADDRSAMPVQG